MGDELERIGDMGLVPVVVIEDSNLAVATAEALIEGGLEVMEITLRTEQGLPAIQKVKQAFPNMLVGAGTVLSVDKAKEAVKAGAEFIVAPGFNPDLVKWCVDNQIAITPGCVTPTEIEQALKYDLRILKFFPANMYGGVNGCKALIGPYSMVKFIPTGGIGLNNLSEYVNQSFIHAVGGGWLCSTSDINTKNFQAITMVVKESINLLLGFEFAHVGINSANDDESIRLANKFMSSFSFQIKQGNTSNFASSAIEINKSVGCGSMGHLAIKTNSINRAVFFLEKRGFTVDWTTRKGPEDNPIAVYLKESFGGFAVHLLKK